MTLVHGKIFPLTMKVNDFYQKSIVFFLRGDAHAWKHDETEWADTTSSECRHQEICYFQPTHMDVVSAENAYEPGWTDICSSAIFQHVPFLIVIGSF